MSSLQYISTAKLHRCEIRSRLHVFPFSLHPLAFILRPTVAVAHPKPHAGAEDSAEAAGAVKGLQGKINTLTNLLVLEVVFWAHNQLTVDHLVNVTVIGQCLKFGLCPSFSVIFDHRIHGGKGICSWGRVKRKG